MDMGNMFQVENMALARDFWYIVAGVMGLLVGVRVINFYKSHARSVSHVSILLRVGLLTSPVDCGDKPPRLFPFQRNLEIDCWNSGRQCRRSLVRSAIPSCISQLDTSLG